MNIVTQLADSPLMRRAMVEAVLVGAVCGLVGVHVVMRRLPFFTLAVAHAAFPGVALASLLGMSLYVGGATSTAVLILAVVAAGSVDAIDSSTATGVSLAGAFAVGVLVQSARAGGSKDLAAFLVGDLLTVSGRDVATTAVVAVCVVSVIATAHGPLVFSAFDPEGARAAGLPVRLLDLLALGLTAVVVVTSVPAVGTILVTTLLVAPALTARRWTDRGRALFPLAAGFGMGAGALGLAASAQWNVAAGASITLASVALLVVSEVAAAGVDLVRRGDRVPIGA